MNFNFLTPGNFSSYTGNEANAKINVIHHDAHKRILEWHFSDLIVYMNYMRTNENMHHDTELGVRAEILPF
jgi:hypothetical protein